MANLENLDKVLGVGLASTWGTAVNADKAYDGDFTFSATQGQSRGVDVNQKYLTRLRRTDLSVSANFSGMVTYEGVWADLAWAFLRGGTETPAEQNVGEGDYLHTMSCANNTAPFYTVAWMENSTTALEIPSFQVQSMTYNSPIGQAATFSFDGVGDRFVQNGENTYAELETLGGSGANYEMAILGCAGTPANHYVRLGDTADALTSGDNIPVTNFTFTMNRQETAQRTTRGANSPYILQPRESGRVIGTLSVTLNVEDTSVIDPIATWLAGTIETSSEFQLEYVVDGSQIGAGDNRTIKWQFPYLCYSTERPTEFNRVEDVVSNPVLTFEIMADPDGTQATAQTATTPSLLITNSLSAAYSS